MSPRLRIFNVAGLMLNGRVDALADGFRASLAPSHLETFAPIPASTVLDAPADAIARTGARIDAFLEASRTHDPDALVVGVGRSFGGYMLLKAASERLSRLDGFSLLVAIEAPLAPHCEVRVPPLLPVLLPAARHYRERPAHADAMVRALAHHRARVLTIGSARDAVIAPDAQRLPGDGSVVQWGPRTTAAEALAARDGALHVVLPPLAPGFAIETAMLPDSYRAHLTWGDEKHRIVNALIAAACR